MLVKQNVWFKEGLVRKNFGKKICWSIFFVEIIFSQKNEVKKVLETKFWSKKNQGIKIGLTLGDVGGD